MKKIISLLCCLSLFSLCFNFSTVSATDYDVFEEELQDAIISGDGTSEHPFVFDANKAPNFKEYLDNGFEKKFYGNSNGISTYSIYSGMLTGTAYNAPKGGEWSYKSGGGTTAVNGGYTFLRIQYTDFATTSVAYATMNKSSLLSIIKSALKNGSAVASSKAFIKYLEAKGISSTAAPAIAKFLGVGAKFFAAYLAVEVVSKYGTLSVLETATSKRKGTLYVSYKTTYNGQWYSGDNVAVWDEYPSAKTPMYKYGVGTFKKY